MHSVHQIIITALIIKCVTECTLCTNCITEFAVYINWLTYVIVAVRNLIVN